MFAFYQKVSQTLIALKIWLSSSLRSCRYLWTHCYSSLSFLILVSENSSWYLHFMYYYYYYYFPRIMTSPHWDHFVNLSLRIWESSKMVASASDSIIANHMHLASCFFLVRSSSVIHFCLSWGICYFLRCSLPRILLAENNSLMLMLNFICRRTITVNIIYFFAIHGGNRGIEDSLTLLSFIYRRRLYYLSAYGSLAKHHCFIFLSLVANFTQV